MSDSPTPEQRRGIFGSIGPAIITASVVLGPGSILSASSIGHQYGYQMTWALVASVVLMIGMTALSARLGVMLDGTLCEELAQRTGRPVSALIGVTLFLIVACFQFGNNLGVLASIEPLYQKNPLVPILMIVGLNALVIVALYGFKSLYQPAERLMKCLVGIMIIGFAANLILARPNLLELLAGLLPWFPDGATAELLPVWDTENEEIVDKFRPVTAMVGTTFSVGGAFYQSYLVRQKGWTRSHLRQGLLDSAVGISMLGLMTLMIMATAAAVLHGRSDVQQLSSVADVARQLEPAFGQSATVLFCLGIFAAAFSSLLANAMIGGSMLSDGLGLGGYIDQQWPKRFTVLAMLIGLGVAIVTHQTGERPVSLIIFAQALTVLGMPILALSMVWLATRRDMLGKVPLWMKVFGSVGLIATIFLAVRTAATLLLPNSEWLRNILNG